MNRILLLAVFCLLWIVALSNAKNLVDNNDDSEIDDQKARMFLRAMLDDQSDDNSDDSAAMDTRHNNGDCVGCKFGAALCCKPNFCRKKRLRPDECVEVKVGK